MGARRRCCCECYTQSDTFRRADSTDLGPLWEECDGDWEIISDTLTTSHADGVVAFKPMVGWPVGLFEVAVLIVDSSRGINSFGATAQVFAFIGSDGSPCSGTGTPWIVELDIIDADEGEMRLYQGGTLIGHRQVLFTTNTTRLRLCVGWDPDLSESEIIAWCSNQVGASIWTCHGGMPDYYFGLGNKGADQVYYESVYYSDHYDHDPTCPDCDIPCCCPCIEAEDRRTEMLNLSVEAGEDPDCYIGGEETELGCEGIEGECCQWTATLAFTCYGDEDHYLRVRMECMGNACEDYYMTLSWPDDPPTYGGNAPACYNGAYPSEWPQTRGIVNRDDCTCQPLNLLFGPYYLWRNPSMLPPDGTQCWCCQEFYIRVVE